MHCTRSSSNCAPLPKQQQDYTMHLFRAAASPLWFLRVCPPARAVRPCGDSPARALRRAPVSPRLAHRRAASSCQALNAVRPPLRHRHAVGSDVNSRKTCDGPRMHKLSAKIRPVVSPIPSMPAACAPIASDKTPMARPCCSTGTASMTSVACVPPNIPPPQLARKRASSTAQ